MANNGLKIECYSEGEMNTRTQMRTHKDNFVRRDNDVSKIQQYHFYILRKQLKLFYTRGKSLPEKVYEISLFQEIM